MSKKPSLEIKGVVSSNKNNSIITKSRVLPKLVNSNISNFKVSVTSDQGGGTLTCLMYPFVVQIKDAEYELNKENELVFKRFTSTPVSNSMTALTGFTTSPNGTKYKRPNISISYKDVSSVNFNGKKAQVRTDEVTNKQYLVFTEEKTTIVVE